MCWVGGWIAVAWTPTEIRVPYRKSLRGEEGGGRCTEIQEWRETVEIRDGAHRNLGMDRENVGPWYRRMGSAQRTWNGGNEGGCIETLACGGEGNGGYTQPLVWGKW